MTVERFVSLMALFIALLALFFVLFNRHARATDIPLPRARPAIYKPEPCMDPDVKPDPGQTLRADKSCPSGLRWVYQR